MSRTVRMIALAAAGALTLTLASVGSASAAELKPYELECSSQSPWTPMWAYVKAQATVDSTGRVLNKSAAQYGSFGSGVVGPADVEVTVQHRGGGGLVIELHGESGDWSTLNSHCYATKVTGSVAAP